MRNKTYGGMFGMLKAINFLLLFTFAHFYFEFPWCDKYILHRNIKYSHFEKKHNIFEVSFLLEKNVLQWIWGYTSFGQQNHQDPMSGQWPRGTRENGHIKVAFLFEKSVHTEIK